MIGPNFLRLRNKTAIGRPSDMVRQMGDRFPFPAIRKP
jgi:hypothetical protein